MIEKLLIVCDAYDPEKEKNGKRLISGVKTHIQNISQELKNRGIKVYNLNPHTRIGRNRIFKTFVTPFDRHFELVINPFIPTARYIKKHKPDAIFISTPEAPIGMAVRQVAKVTPNITRHNEIPYTSSYHTNLDIYFTERISEISGGIINVDPSLINKLTVNVYKDSYKVLVPTETIEKKVNSIGIENTVIWPRGIDSDKFKLPNKNESNPYENYTWYDKQKYLLLYFGRISYEKNLEDFLKIKSEKYHKVLIGDGPYLDTLKNKFGDDNNLHFLDAMFGDKLYSHVRFADLMVFPSKFDTFGNVITEACASGVPVLAYDTQGPSDVIKKGMGIKIPVGEDLKKYIEKALEIDKNTCRDVTIKNYSWEKSTNILLDNLEKIDWK